MLSLRSTAIASCLSLVLAIGCAAEGGRVIVEPPETPSTRTGAPAGTAPAPPAEASRAVERRVPGRIVGGVYYPAHVETFLVRGGDEKDTDLPPSLTRGTRRDRDGTPGRNVLPRVTVVFRNVPLGEAVRDLLRPAGLRLETSPRVNVSLPVTLRLEGVPLTTALAEVIGPYGYRARVDLARRKVLIE